MHGRYIVIEGIEGSGKTTACYVVANALRSFGVKEIIFVREPGSTKLAENLRRLVLDVQYLNNELIHDKVEVLIFYAARVQLVETVIKPALAKGCWVIGDRHDLSTQAYQGGGRCVDTNILMTLRNIMLGNFYPHLTLYLDITPEISMRRTCIRSGNLNRIEKEKLDFFERTRLRYIELASIDDSIHTIDATQSLNKVNYTINTIISQWFHKQIIQI